MYNFGLDINPKQSTTGLRGRGFPGRSGRHREDSEIPPAKQMSRGVADNAIAPSLLAIGASKPVANITSMDLKYAENT